MEITFGDHREAFRVERLEPHLRVVHHEGDSWSTAGTNKNWIRLNDVDLSLQKCGADAEQGLMVVGEFDADQVTLNQGQPGSLKDFTTLLGVAEEETHKGTLSRIVDREGDNPHTGTVKPPHHLEQLSDTVFKKYSELPEGGPIPAPRRCETDTRT